MPAAKRRKNIKAKNVKFVPPPKSRNDPHPENQIPNPFSFSSIMAKPPGQHPALLQSMESLASSVNEATSTPNPKHGVAAVRLNRISQPERSDRTRISNALKSAAREVPVSAPSPPAPSPSPPHLTVKVPSPSQQESYIWSALWEAYAATTTAQVAADQLYVLGLLTNDQYDTIKRSSKMAITYITQQLLLVPSAREKLTKQALSFVSGGLMERSVIRLQSISTAASVRAAGDLASIDAILQKVMIDNEE